MRVQIQMSIQLMIKFVGPVTIWLVTLTEFELVALIETFEFFALTEMLKMLLKMLPKMLSKMLLKMQIFDDREISNIFSRFFLSHVDRFQVFRWKKISLNTLFQVLFHLLIIRWTFLLTMTCLMFLLLMFLCLFQSKPLAVSKNREVLEYLHL